MSIRLCVTLMMMLTVNLSAYALKPNLLPAEFQTKNKQQVMRKLALKLPIQGTDYHWVFTDPQALFAGKLILSITHANGKIDNTIVFNQGQLNKNWKTLDIPTGIQGIYFEFVSTKKYPTAPNDKLDLTLIVTKPVPGIGPCIKGTLVPGTYSASGIYSGLTDTPDLTQTTIGKLAAQMSPQAKAQLLGMINNRAFLQTWYQQWPLKDVSDDGWLMGKSDAGYCDTAQAALKRKTHSVRIA